MADLRINLLRNRPTLSESEYLRERKILTWTVIGMVVTVVVVVALTAWSWVLTAKLAGIESDITRANEEIADLTQANANQIYLKSRLKLITNYLDERSIIRESLQKVLTNEVAGTQVVGAFYVSDNVLRIQVLADNNDRLMETLAYYQESNTYFTQVISRGITRNREGTYQLSLDLTVPKGGGK